MDKCPIKGVSDDCEKCSESNPEACVYVKTFRYVQSGELRHDKGKPWEPLVKEIGSSREKPNKVEEKKT